MNLDKRLFALVAGWLVGVPCGMLLWAMKWDAGAGMFSGFAIVVLAAGMVAAFVAGADGKE